MIDKCVFNNNNAKLYGGAIFSNQGNDVTIEKSVFTNLTSVCLITGDAFL